MVEQPPEPKSFPVRKGLFENEPAPRRVFLDPSSPSIRSILRVAIVGLIVVFVAGFVESLILSIASVFFMIILSVFLAYLIDPLVRLIRRPFEDRNKERWMPRPAAIGIAYLFLFAALGLAISYVAPRIVDQAKDFGTSFPGYVQAFRARSNEINRRFDRLRVPDEVQAEMNKKVADIGTDITAWVGNFVLLSFTYLPWFFLVPILSFFFLKDVNLFRLAILRMFPAGRWRGRAESVLEDVNKTLAAYTRAQLISCLLISAICTLGFYVIGLKYALLLGMLAGIFEFVPMLGPLAIGLLVTATAAASEEPQNAIYVAIFLIVLRVIHDYVTYPRIVQGGIHLHPLAIILSVLVGEKVAGIPGVFISIPIVAVGTVIYRHILEHQGRHSLISGWIERAEAQRTEVP
jgi:predicted PurR-regulated permease PerM